MKKKALAIILALCMVLSMLPMSVSAAQPQPVTKTAPMKLDELPREVPAISTQAKYTVSLTGGSNGTTELLVSSPAAAGSEVYFLAAPYDGYLAEIYFDGLDAEDFVYIGMDIWGFIMPSNRVTLEVEYVEASGVARDIHVRASKGGQFALERDSAKRYESVMLLVLPDKGVSFDPETDVTTDEGDLYYLMEDEDGIHYYELVMGSYDANIEICFGGNPIPRYVELSPVPAAAGTVSVNRTEAYPGDEIIVTAVPNLGYKLEKVSGAVDSNADRVKFTAIGNNRYKAIMPDADVDIYVSFTAVYHRTQVNVVGGVGGRAWLNRADTQPGQTITLTCVPDENYRVYSITGVDGLVDKGNNVYEFVMPDRDVIINVTFKPIYNPVTVTVETGLGGTAAVDVETAKAGDTVKVTCQPQEGYRVAQITGVNDLVDNGDNTYSFIMPDKAVNLKVLFLRENNPFLDINETQFFYDSVLWAYENGITGGVDATHFGPAGVCNRAQVVTFLWSAAGKPAPTLTVNPFVDIPEKSWYTDAVLWAYEKGITAGSDDTHFNPGGVCNRAQVVTFLYKANGGTPTITENPFSDVPDGSWYAAPVLWALENGITSGADDTHFNPGGQCLRAFAVTFLHKADQLPDVYAVNAQFDETLGTVTLSHTRAAAGEAVIVTAVPFRGCKLEQLWCESGADLYPLFGADGYCFYMPDQQETVHATFVKVEPSNIPPTDPDGQLYVLDLYAGCFHDPDCVEIEQIDPWNYYEYTGLRESLIDHDYYPCNTCLP